MNLSKYLAAAILGVLLGLACCEVVERVTLMFASAVMDGDRLEVVPKEMDY